MSRMSRLRSRSQPGARHRLRDARRRQGGALRLRQVSNVLTSLEFERMTNASGPTGGKIVTKTKKRHRRRKVEEWVADPRTSPKSVAIIHCVGSRDTNYNSYCSRGLLHVSLKFAHLVREKLPDAACYEFYIDMRAFGRDTRSSWSGSKPRAHTWCAVERPRSLRPTGSWSSRGGHRQDRLVQYPRISSSCSGARAGHRHRRAGADARGATRSRRLLLRAQLQR